MDEKKKRRSIVTGIVTFLFLTGFLLFFIHRMDKNIFGILKSISPASVFLLLSAGFFYQFMEAMVCRAMIRESLPRFSVGNALDVTFTGVFGNIVTSAAGSIPMQSYYLHRQGLMFGSGVGLMTLEYIFHKTAITVLAFLALCLHRHRLQKDLSSVFPYLFISFAICFLIICFLLLLCSWKKVREFACQLLERLPNSGKWKQRKQDWQEHLFHLYEQSRLLLNSRSLFLKIAALEIGKLLVLYSIPYFCVTALHAEAPSLFYIQALSCLMMLISNAIPNLAGIGSAEFSFYLIFSGLFGNYTLASLLLYRMSTYYFPFFLSVLWFLYVQRKLMNKTEGVSKVQTP